MAVPKLDMQALQSKDALSDDDLKALQTDILNEEKTPEEIAKEEADAAERKAVEEAAGKEAEKQAQSAETEEEKQAREKAEAEAAEKAKEKPAEELSEEEKNAKAAKEAEEKTKQEAEAKKAQEEVEKEISAYATEHQISPEEAKADFESRSKILEKYKNDPKALALANLHLQRAFTKAQEEVKAIKDAKPVQEAKALSLDNIIQAIDDGKITVKGKPAAREDIISAYREQYPDITENVDDDAVIKLAAKEIRDNVVKSQEAQSAQITVQAKDKRAALLSSIPEADKRFIPEIQPVLDKIPDSVIVSPKFNLVPDMIRWAKGGIDLTKLEKDAEERGYKRGMEQAKIIAQKETPSSSGSTKPKSAAKTSLSEADKKRALEMFDGTTFTDDEKFAAYTEILEIENRKK